jgi:hypothetical protein
MTQHLDRASFDELRDDLRLAEDLPNPPRGLLEAIRTQIGVELAAKYKLTFAISPDRQFAEWPIPFSPDSARLPVDAEGLRQKDGPAESERPQRSTSDPLEAATTAGTSTYLRVTVEIELYPNEERRTT